jgi:hypothetical protein
MMGNVAIVMFVKILRVILMALSQHKRHFQQSAEPDKE